MRVSLAPAAAASDGRASRIATGTRRQEEQDIGGGSIYRVGAVTGFLRMRRATAVTATPATSASR